MEELSSGKDVRAGGWLADGVVGRCVWEVDGVEVSGVSGDSRE